MNQFELTTIAARRAKRIAFLGRSKSFAMPAHHANIVRGATLRRLWSLS